MIVLKLEYALQNELLLYGHNMKVSLGHAVVVKKSLLPEKQVNLV